MELYLKKLIAERNMSMVSFGKMGNVEYETLKTMLKRKSCKVSTLAKYASMINVPTWELIYDCGVSALGHELPEWNTPNTSMRIRDIMEEKGVDQKTLAKKMGVVAPAVSTLLSRNNPGLPNIEAIANALEVEPYELFISKEDMQREIARRKGEPVAERVVSMEQPERKPMEDSYQEDLFAQNETTASDDDMIITMGGRRYRLVPMD